MIQTVSQRPQIVEPPPRGPRFVPTREPFVGGLGPVPRSSRGGILVVRPIRILRDDAELTAALLCFDPTDLLGGWVAEAPSVACSTRIVPVAYCAAEAVPVEVGRRAIERLVELFAGLETEAAS